MALLLLSAAWLCLKLPVQLCMQLNDDERMTLLAVFFISIALFISHKVHMLTGR